MKKILTLIVACVMIFAAVPAVLAEEKPIVTALLPASQLPGETNRVLTEIRERTGIDFQPLIVENTEHVEKRNSMAAGKILPDIIQVGGYTELKEMVDNGVILPLDDLLESHGQEILANHAGAEKDTIAYMNGKTYGIIISQPRMSALMVRQDWLDNLGLEVPTTIDDFYKVLHAFTYDDPNKNGEQDTVGLAATMAFPTTIHVLFTAFGIPYGRPVLVDDQVVPFFMHPDFLKAVEFARKLYNEGLMEPEFVTIPNMSCLQKLWGGNYGFYFGDPIGTTNNWFPTRYTEDPLPVMTYTAILNDEGIGGALDPHYGSYFAITSGCKNPEAAMDLLNYMCTEEGNQLAYAGIEGYHWQWRDDGKIDYLNEFTDATAQRNDGVYCYFPCLRFDGMERQILTEITQYGYKVAEAHVVPDAYINVTPEIDGEITFNEAEMITNLIVGTEDLEALYQVYLNDYLENGGSTWIEQATEIYKNEKGL